MSEDVDRVKVGDRAFVSHHVPCGMPTAVAARTVIPASSPSPTSFPRFTSESCSWAAPTKIDNATADALSHPAPGYLPESGTRPSLRLVPSCVFAVCLDLD